MKFQVEINCLVSTIENTHDGNGKIPIDCSVCGRRRLKTNQYAKLMGVSNHHRLDHLSGDKIQKLMGIDQLL
jgi:hypothetical protein